MQKILRATLCLCLVIVFKSTDFPGTCSPPANVTDEDAFTIQHSGTGKCLSVGASSGPSLAVCDPGSSSQQWKWGSGHRLYHVDTARCLALNVGSKALTLVDCGSNILLWWRCLDGVVYTAYEMTLDVTDEQVSTKRGSNSTWLRGGGSQHNICHKPYRVIHTTGGNSAGSPCVFPFKHNGSWHHGCLPDAEFPGLSWCATSSDFDQDRKMGHCLIAEEGCQTLFAETEGDSCYEFVPGVAVTWHEALDSCRSQGADLVSFSKPDDLHSKAVLKGLETMPERMWIGLHQLDTSQGWQWSDGSPLSVLRWQTGVSAPSTIIESDCGVFNSRNSNYESEACNKRLPYVCQKSVNASQGAKPEPFVYKETVCTNGWVPWNGWCYKLVRDTPLSFHQAQLQCNNTEDGGGGSLATFHSIDSKEMVSTNFHSNGQLLDVWIGLVGVGSNTTVFKWIDEDPVTFTYWLPDQPQQPTMDTSCVFYSGETHGWRVGSCTDKLPFMCQRKGEFKESETKTGCPAEQGWKRHGNSCYQISATQVSFKDQCNMTVRNRFEQAFISRLLAEQIGMETQYFWIGLQDMKNTGEYRWLGQNGSTEMVTYTNWGWFEPARSGGCAVMSTAKPLGKWKVENCALFKAGTICRVDLNPPPEPEPEYDLNATCPSGWVSRPDIPFCYKVFQKERLSRKRSWEEAERFCQALGANLPSFTSSVEMRALHSIMRESISGDRYFWVGLNRRDPADRSWQWSNGQPVTMDVLQQDFHEDDAYDRDCTAFKTTRSTLKHLLVFLMHDLPPIPFYATPFHCDAQLEWVCQIPRGKKPKNPDWYNPVGFHETSVFYDGTEFWFVDEPLLTFEEAQLFCSANGSKLAEPKNTDVAAKIQLHLEKVSASPAQRWWIDLRKHVRLYPMSYSQLYRYYYSGSRERCSSISQEPNVPRFDTMCQQRLSFVCEKHNITSVEVDPLEPQPGGLPCGNSSIAFRNKCYTLMTSLKPVTFKYANDECESVRGSLISISDQVEQDFITTLLPRVSNMNRIWIGLRIHSDMEWVDKSPVSFVNFHPLLLGMQRAVKVNSWDPESFDFCAFMINNPNSAMMGTWDYTPCARFHHLSVCQHYSDKAEEPSITKEPFTVNNHTFLLLPQNNLTWFEALELCLSQHMDLASVADTFIQSVLTVAVSRARTPMWIGLFSEDEGIHYRWTDHSHTVFSRWSPEGTSGSCVYLDTDGFWKATECEEQRGAICHKPHEVVIITPDDVAVKCPHKINGPNWIPFKNNCYSFQLVVNRWDHFDKNNISDTCRQLDDKATILTVRHAEENEFVKQQLVPFQNLAKFVWLGLFKDPSSNRMKWYDGTYVQYSNWLQGRPDTNQTFMAGLALNGKWILVPDQNSFSEFKQVTIVACKLDNESKEEYNKTTKDYQMYNNMTYKVLPQSMTWYQALQECGQLGGHLASVHDVDHASHVNLIVKTDGFPLWVGLSSQDFTDSSYEWSDGTAYNFNVAVSDLEDQPDTKKRETKCVFVTPDGDWMRTSCNAEQSGAVCYTATLNTDSQRVRLQAAPEANRCPQDNGRSLWVQHQDHCYAFNMSFYNYSVYSMAKAKSICQSLGAELLTIKSTEENEFVSKYIKEDPLATNRVWLGLDFSNETKAVTWLDGSELAYTNWKPEDSSSGDSGGRQAKPQCAVLMTGDEGTWKRVSCTGSYSRVVCKTQAKSSGSPVALGFLILILVLLLLAIGFFIYKKKRSHFSSAVRYERTYDDSDTTGIYTD